MRLSLFFMFLFTVSASASALSQNVTLNVKSETLNDVLSRIKNEAGVQILYDAQAVKTIRCNDIYLENVPVKNALDNILRGTGFEYREIDDVIVIRKSNAVLQQDAVTITGTVRDTDGIPIVGATVQIKGTQIGAATDKNGTFAVRAGSSSGVILIFSFLGKQTVEITYTGQQNIMVTMEDNTAEIDAVVVTGMFNRRAESFTGSARTIKRDELLQVGNQNLIKSLGNIDPSFMIMESLEFGSDPNKMPEIQMRGQSSFPDLEGTYSGNPNQPLFILDGFETDIRKVYDMDMNRVESITILKDAAAKAIYGSKAANGVVVIELVRPHAGRLTVQYSGDLNIEAPDLTGYNLMNASEKLAFELERNMYRYYGDNASWVLELDKLYQKNLDAVLRGVDTYWLSKPLRTGVGQKHSITLEGGDTSMRYSAGFSYNGIQGVMKESKRETFIANTTLSYTYKNLIFRNTIEFTRNWANNSPYGSFSEYTKLNPYWIPYDDNGNPTLLLGTYFDNNYYNPLYNANIGTKSTSEYTEVRDNFIAEWKILPDLKAVGRFSYTHNSSKSDLFYPGSHTMFIEYDEAGWSDRKGRYTKGDGESESIYADVGVNYSRLFDKHLIFANATWNMSSANSISHAYIAEGFGNSKMNDIAFATKYPENGKPTGYSDRQREIGIIGALNYSYDDRYLFDASIRRSASSVFGSDNRWGTFWSLGLGWNLHREAFAANANWLDQLKIRGSVGYTGSQNFNPFQARAMYEYVSRVYDNKLGATLIGMPNSKLKWQRVLDYNAGMDLSVLQRITLRFDYFISETNDLLIDVTAPPSIGFNSYKENLGKIENKGFETTLAVTPWRNNEKRGWLTLTVSAMHNKNKIKEISDSFSHRNDKYNEEKDTYNSSFNEEITNTYTRPSTLYYEGQSMTAIWGVKSAGVDPVTGKELFYDLNGNQTYNWLSANQVVIGDTAPKLRGNINLSAGYKGFTLALTCSYKFGGDLYNTTLVDKLENADGKGNLDKRILKSWRQTGDIAPYKKMTISSAMGAPNYTKPTSRFVQKDNELYISSLNVSYDFYNLEGLARIGLERLKVSFYMNELFRFSSIEIERGTSYPFSRNFSFSLQATF